MTSVRPDLDLRELERPKTTPASPRRRLRMSRIWPWFVLAGFGWFLQDVIREALEETIAVRIIRPRRLEGPLATSRRVLVQAAGWVEPDPFPIHVTALTEGVVARVLVQEADHVERGATVAELVAEDALLSERAAASRVQRAEAERDEARAERDVARAAFEAAIERREAVATARAALAAAEATWHAGRHAETEAYADYVIRERELDTQRYLVERDAASPWQIELAQAELERACARIARARSDSNRRAAERDAARALLERALAENETRFEEHLRIERSEPVLARREADLLAARIALEQAALARERTIVRAPEGGVVLTRDAAPGSPVGPTRGPLVTLYDPARLRVRVDVPQSKVEGLGVGLAARIACDARPGRPYVGRVTRLVETADIQKVTLEVQVEIEDPDASLKPDMLCQVTFLAPEATSSPDAVPALLLPSRCIQPGDRVFVIDGRTGRLSTRRLRLGESRGDDRIVLDGLDLSCEVVLPEDPALRDGARIRVIAEVEP